MANNSKCLCCGDKYSYCPTCSRVDALKPSWFSDFCSETCMTLWTTLTKYGMEFITKNEANDTISKLDLKPIDVYADCVQRDYAKVMTEEKKSHKITKKIESVATVEPIVEQLEVANTREVVDNKEE